MKRLLEHSGIEFGEK